MKRLKEIYNKVLESAMHESELTLEQLANSRAENCVITRVVIVETLIKLGLTENDIVRLSGMSQQRINSLTQLCPFYLVFVSVSAVLQWRFALLCTTDFIYSDFLYDIFLYFSCS